MRFGGVSISRASPFMLMPRSFVNSSTRTSPGGRRSSGFLLTDRSSMIIADWGTGRIPENGYIQNRVTARMEARSTTVGRCDLPEVHPDRDESGLGLVPCHLEPPARCQAGVDQVPEFPQRET